MEIKRPDIENMINQEIKDMPSYGNKPLEETPPKNRLAKKIVDTMDRVLKKEFPKNKTKSL